MLYSTEDYVAASFRFTESELTIKRPMGETGKKRPLESNGQTQEDKENIQIAPHVSADGEDPMNVKSIRCHCTVKQKQRVVLYHGVRHIELRKFWHSTKEHPTVVEELL